MEFIQEVLMNAYLLHLETDGKNILRDGRDIFEKNLKDENDVSISMKALD